MVDLDSVVLNEEKMTGINPYDRKLDFTEFRELFTSRKSAFQISTRTHFLWWHRKNIITFVITWLTDYSRLLSVVLLRWIMTDKMYRKVKKYYLQLISA